MKIIRAYGVRQKDRDIALPSTFIVGLDGRIRFVYVAPNPVDRLRTQDLLTSIERKK